MIDLEAYFTRIGYRGSPAANLTTLRDLHALHVAAVPFENIDPFVARPVPLGLADLQAKLVGSRRGGYCFEQNTLFKAVLEAIGFPVTTLAARVRWMVPPDAPPNPRAHMTLKVDLPEGVYIADVGFGGFLFAEPLELAPDAEQSTRAGMLRFVHSDGVFVTLQARLSSGWQDVYRFTLEPQFPIDQEVANWFTATHPNSRFRNNLLIERLRPEVRVSLFNRRVTRRYPDGRVEVTLLAAPDELEELLAVDFDLESPASAETLFARLPV